MSGYWCRLAVAAISACLLAVIRVEAIGDNAPKSRRRVAIIGGGIGGTFAAKFLADYDGKCLLDPVVLFDPSPQLSSSSAEAGGMAKGTPYGYTYGGSDEYIGPDRQGSRVSSLTLEDGAVVELGASILYSGNKLVTDLVDADPNLVKVGPGSQGGDNGEGERSMPNGFGIYDGHGVWDILTSNTPDYILVPKMLWRYGVDLIRMRNAVMKAFASFSKIYDLLNGTAMFESPDDLWRAVGLYEVTTISFDDYLDNIGIAGEKSRWSWWRSLLAHVMPGLDSFARLFLPGQGNLRREVLESINLNNYNQPNVQLDGLAGLVSFIPTLGDVYSVKGGNVQILTSAFRQAKETHATKCSTVPNDDGGKILHKQDTVSSVVYLDNSIELWDQGRNLGAFDVVILAAPLQQCQISFLSRNVTGGEDPLHLDGMSHTELTRDLANSIAGQDQPLPSSATRRYMQTVTTIVSNATLRNDHFHLSEKDMPRVISVTVKGKESEGFSAMAQLTANGVFKLFSSEPLSGEALGKLFGPHYRLEYVKVWGGQHGGAYPDFDGGGAATRPTPFRLHGGGDSQDGSNSGPALYYINAIEASVAAMEISAIGAKAVAKLVARRLGLL